MKKLEFLFIMILSALAGMGQKNSSVTFKQWLSLKQASSPVISPELYRGLQDRGIPSKLIVYKGFGHGITKPKERLAAI